MPDYDFSYPHRQSGVGLILIFATAVFQLIRSLWVVILYFLVRDVDQQAVLLILIGLGLVLVLTLIYSVLAFKNFLFHIDQQNREFVLQKGVFSTDTTNIPFHKIQQVNFKRNLLQRIIGVYSVMVETAGSQEKEIEIKALSEEMANALAERLMELKKEETHLETSFEKEEENKEKHWHYKVPFVTLLKLGLTSNYLRGVAIIITFYFTLREQFFLEDLFPSSPSGQQIIEKGSFLFVIGLLIFGMFITVAETLIKYFGLNLTQYKDALQVEMGLRNNTKVNLRSKRVQMIEVSTNPIQKWLELYRIKLSLASSENDLEKNRIKIPGLPPEIVGQVKSFFLKTGDEPTLNFHPHKIVLWRKLSRGMIPAILAVIAGFWFQDVISLGTLGVVLSLYLILLTLYNYLYYKNLRLDLTKLIMIKHSGVWVKKKQYLEVYRLQAVSIRQPLWYKRKGLVNLTFHSAGGDIVFNGVKKEKIISLVNMIVYQIERTKEPWM